MPPTTSSASTTPMIRPMGDPAASSSAGVDVGMAAAGSSVGVGVRVGSPGTSVGVGAAVSGTGVGVAVSGTGVGVVVSGTGVGVAVSGTGVGVTIDGASLGVAVGILGTGGVGIGEAVSAGVGVGGAGGGAGGGAADHTRAKVEKRATDAEKTRLLKSNEVRKEVQWPPSSDGLNRWMLSLPKANSLKTEPIPPISWTSASVSIALSVALNQKFTLRNGLPAALNRSTWMTRRTRPSGGTTRWSVGGA